MGHIPTYNKRITLADRYAAAKREYDLRVRKYPDWVSGPRPMMKPDEAAFQLAAMAAIVEDYEKLLKLNSGEQTTIF